MRPSSTLIALVLISAAVTVFTSVWWRDMSYLLLLIWFALAALTVADLVISHLAGRMTIDFDLPPQGFVGHTTALTVGIRRRRARCPRKPKSGSISLPISSSAKSDGSLLHRVREKARSRPLWTFI